MQKKISVFIVLIVMAVFSACSRSDMGSDSSATSISAPVAGKKIAYVVNIEESELFTLCAERCVETAKKLGMSCDVYFSDGDDEAWEEAILKYAAEGYDGLILSHGGTSYSYNFLVGLLDEYSDLKIVTFDTQFVDDTGETKTIEGVTQVFQDDIGFSEILCNYICDGLYTEKVKANQPVNVLKVWKGPKYLAPFDRRDEGYSAYEKNGKINTVEVVEPDDVNDPENSTYESVRRTLALYEESEIDAVWVCYDAYARGAYRALKESGKDISLVTVDICNSDIQMMLEENSKWEACACTDFKSNGEECVRILALELNDEYDCIFDPKTREISSYIEMPGTLITQRILTSATTVENLYDIAPKSYGAKEFFSTNEWLKKSIGY